MLRKLYLTKILLLGLLFTGINSWGQYTGTGTFTKITSTADLTDGYYVIAYEDAQAMSNSHNGTFFVPQAISPSNGTTLDDPNENIVWRIEVNGSGRTIFNEALQIYASYAGGSNNVQSVTSVSGNNQRWTFANGNPFTVNNAQVTNRRLQYNTGAPRFACYTGSQQDITLYKFEEPAAPLLVAGPATNVTTSSATITGIIASAGQSAITEYGAEYSTTANFEPGTGITVLADNLAGSDFSLILEELVLNTTYYFRVFATNSEGTGYSDQNAFTTQAVGTPVAIEATDTTATTFTANWTATAGAESYRLDVSELEDFGTITPGTTITETFENMPSNGVSYSNVVWTGNNGVEWSANDSRTDQTLTGRAITLRSSELTNTTPITGGLSTLSFQYKRVFSGNSVLRVFVNDIQYGGDITVSSDTPSTFSENINVAGTITIRIENTGERTVIDDLTITTPEINDTEFVEGYENLTVTGTSIEVTGLEPATTYYYRVRAVAGENTSVNSNVISVETGVINIWNGTEWTLGTPPTIDDEAAIEGDYNTADQGEFEASLLTVNSGTFTIAEGTSITVDGAVINNGAAEDFIIENNANLIQVNNDANTGDIYIIKNGSPLYRLDYTIWSSPVVSQNLAAFSPNTTEERFYIYDTEADEYVSIDPATNNFEPGAGYLIRMPNGYPNSDDTAGYNDGETAVSFEGVFTGTANNGMISIPLSTAGGGFNMVGNPYPSPINIYDFYDSNTGAIDEGSALYFWRKTNDPNASSYATITKLAYAENEAVGGDTGSTTFIGNPEEWVINPGQGFFVQAATGVDLVFTNTMRRNVNNGQFFRTSEDESTISRIWLNISGAENGFSQSVIGYTEVTTNGLDYGWDGKSINSGGLSFYSLVQETELSIQARSQFAVTDVVPMGYRADVAGSYTITLNDMDGVYAGDQDVFIKDNVTGTVHNLKDSDYTFATSEGTFNNRLEVVYQNEALSAENPVFNANNVVVYKSGNTISINTGNVQMTGVNVYDVRGSLLYSQTSVNAIETTIDNLNSQQQVLIINISTDKGEVSKKIVF